MVATALYLKKIEPDCEVVFIGPCISKKADVLSRYIDVISAVITFEELVAMLRAKRVSLKKQQELPTESSQFGKGFARSGGVASAIKKAIKEHSGEDIVQSLKIHVCNGSSECFSSLKLLKYKKLDVDFIEGMCCTGGCIAGPSVMIDSKLTKKLFEVNSNNEMIGDIIKKHELDKLMLHRKS